MYKPNVKTVRIIFTDPDATDSSSSSEEEEEEIEEEKKETKKKEKRQMVEMSVQQNVPCNPKKFRGVRARPWGRFSAEIRDSGGLDKRLWLGTFDTAKEAASVYDRAAVSLKGEKAVTNFPVENNAEAEEVAERVADGGGENSPTSVIGCGEDDCLVYEDVSAWGFRVEDTFFWNRY